jgi:hypothetical protein
MTWRDLDDSASVVKMVARMILATDPRLKKTQETEAVVGIILMHPDGLKLWCSNLSLDLRLETNKVEHVAERAIRPKIA